MTDYSYEDQSTTGSYGQEITTPQYAGVGQNGSATPKPAIQKKPMGFVGFSNLPNQVHRKSVRKGFQFTAMVVGVWRVLPVVSLFIDVGVQASQASESLLSSTHSSRQQCTLRRRRWSLQRSGPALLPLRASALVSNHYPRQRP
jgi:hypothetical protein